MHHLEVPRPAARSCAGEGKAASEVGRAFDCETWGAELSPERAAKAAQVMNRVFNATWQVCQLNDESTTVLYLNPPYETDRFDSRKRLEYDFLKSTTPKLVRGGLLIYVIPQKVLGIIEVARLLANYYECLTVARFPDGEFETFKQVVVLGYRRKSYQAATDKEILAIQAMASENLPVLEPLGDRSITCCPRLNAVQMVNRCFSSAMTGSRRRSSRRPAQTAFTARRSGWTCSTLRVEKPN
jgi:hypothetical protein